ncbi:G-type lectin S-receptor serine/threonine-protein kinase RLK1 [Spatholobus suberectus]|nr:G-type lectin S-receptor serine/threonine-protein kinase RLK1 [Spatholobus suberectus]
MDIMAIAITFLLLMCAGTRVETQPPKQQIKPSASLLPNSTPAWWPSPSGQFAFGFYPQGQGSVFVVAIWLISGKNETVVWTAQRNDPEVTSNAKLQLTMDGKLVLMDGQGEDKVIAGNASAKASSASMLDSGNFVLYNNNSSIIWQSFDYPTDTLLGGQSLPNGHQLVSSSSQNGHSSGRYRLKMQDDGNLVLYPVNTSDKAPDAYWYSNTFNSGFKTHLYLNQTGSPLIINGSDGGIIGNLDGDSSLANNGSRIIYRATLNFDGIFRLYAHFNNGSIQKVENWPRGKNSCRVKGFCGFNSYCTFNDAQPECSCLSGFEFIYPTDSTLGCKRRFQKEDCSGEKDSATFYDMKQMEDIVWVDDPYFQAEMSQEDCSSTCLADCTCEAAFYDGESCMKQRLPLRYLRWSIENEAGAMLFLKVGKSLKNGTGNDNPVPELPPPPPPPIKTTSNKATVKIIVITSVFFLLLCSTIVISSHYIYKIRIFTYKKLMETGNLGLNEELTLRRFSYSELKRATNNFKQELGKGSFGAVYKGALHKGRRLIAVKRLEKLVEEGDREFQAEMRAIGKTHHRNLLNKLLLWEAVDKTVAENMVKVALWCVQDEPILRPTMKSVVLMLEGITDIAIPPCPNSNYM